ncbi:MULTISPECIES: hypothetical protein [unclassified Clostridium]|uniref:hypothetical protein n=1 Tax=unclassified Clostridium TaxID=2614128 RepID=UPI000298002E|nr:MULTISPECIES: hypothetical protein [unclassified Clostridium]EKQ54371.1 MAG: hypothetical protein A370_03194 [Clostridium sp. Maddingley MBC34-26]
MKKFFFMFLLCLYLSFNLLSIPSMAQQKTIKEGVYRSEDLNLSENMTHTIKNPSNNEYAFIMAFDSNQITQQYMQLIPNSEAYILTPLEPGYQLLVVTNDEIIID